MQSLYYSTDELKEFGFAEVGHGVKVSRKTSFYNITGNIGSNVRIDDFCILKGCVDIGWHVHISAFCSISGARGKVTLGDFSTLSNRVSIYTGSDDYRANALSSSTVPDDYLATIEGDVLLEQAALVGAHSVILPKVRIGAAASVGALCLVYKSLPAGAVAISDPPGVRISSYRDVAAIVRMAEAVLARSKLS